jgi:hypothetical protein
VTKGNREEVVQWFEQAMFSGHKHWKTVEREGAIQWKFTMRQSRNYMKLVRDRWRKNRAEDADGLRDQLDGVQRRVLGLALGDEVPPVDKDMVSLRDANQAIKNLIAIHGLENKTVTVAGALSLPPGTEGKTDEQVKAELEEMRKAQDKGKG